MGTLKKGFPVLAAALLSSLIFAAAHIIPLQMAYVLPTALILTFTFLWTDSLYASIALHLAFNLTSTVSALLARRLGAESALLEQSSGSILPYVIAAVIGGLVTWACMYVIWKRRKVSALSRPNREQPPEEVL